MVSISSSQAEVLGILLLFVLWASYRTYRMTRGASASPQRLATITGLYLFLFALSAASDALLFPIAFVGVEVVLLLVGAVLTTFYVRRHVEISPHPQWGWSYRLSFALPAVYLILFCTRMGVDLLLLGGIPGLTTSSTSPLPSVSGLSLVILAVVDALFAVSAGLITGRSVGVYLALRDHQAKPPPSGPLPSA